MEKTKIINCIHCKKEMEVNIRAPNIQTCKVCLKNGLEDPRLKFIEKANKKRKETIENNKFKNVICYYCKESFKIHKNADNSFSVCKHCRSKGLKNIRAQKTGSSAKPFVRTVEYKKKLSNSLKETFKDKNKKERIINQRKKTLLEKTGFEHQMYNPFVRDKVRKTTLENHGFEYPLQNNDIKKKTKSTCLKKYSVEYSLQSKDIREKGKITSIKKYGVDHWSKTKEGKELLREKGLKFYKKDRENILKYLKIKLLDTEYKNAHYKHNWLCLDCNKSFQTLWNYIQQGYKCPHCYPSNNGISKLEKEILDYIKEINNTNIEANNRNIIKSPYSKLYLELDIIIPDKKVAIEFNGLFYHSSENNIEPNYHVYKTDECEKQNIQLIHIFEDEWLFKKEIVKSRLKSILKSDGLIKIHARKCIVKEIDSKDKNNFLLDNHIQGMDNSSIKLGAFYNNDLVSVMTFSKGNISKGSNPISGVWELNRFCNKINYHIPGIANKLLSYFKRNYKWKKIFSYADRRWSNGNLYNKLGFELQSKTGINYWYIKEYKRIHRFSLRKKPNEPKDIPEWVLRSAEGYHRIWDCGNLKFVLENRKNNGK